MTVLKRLGAWYIRRRIVRDLEAFSHRELRDMGITEGDIRGIAAE